MKLKSTPAINSPLKSGDFQGWKVSLFILIKREISFNYSRGSFALSIWLLISIRYFRFSFFLRWFCFQQKINNNGQVLMNWLNHVPWTGWRGDIERANWLLVWQCDPTNEPTALVRFYFPSSSATLFNSKKFTYLIYPFTLSFLLLISLERFIRVVRVAACRHRL